MAYIPVTNQSVSGTVGASVIGLPYFGMAGSVAAAQLTNPWVITGSIQGNITATTGNSSVQLVGGKDMIGSVAAYQGTTPWVMTGSVQATLSPAANQSVSGQVDAFIVGGSITTVGGSTGNSSVQVLNFPSNQSVSGNVGASIVGGLYKSNTPFAASVHSGIPQWGVRNEGNVDFSGNDGDYIPMAVDAKGHLLMSQSEVFDVFVRGSVATRATPASVQLLGSSNVIGSVAAYQGTNPWIVGNSSVMIAPGLNTIGSVAALQGTNPWMVQLTSGSVITSGGNSSVTAFQGSNPWIITGSVQGNFSSTSSPTSVQLLSGNGNIGSVTAYQGATPWVITGSIQGGGGGTQYVEDTAQTSITATAILFRKSNTTSVMSAISPSSPLPTVGSVSGELNVIQTTSPWRTATSITGGVSSVSQVGNWNIQPASVQVLAGTNPIGSVAVLQGTNPWLIGNSSVMLATGTNTAGSIVAIQGTSPWRTATSITGGVTSVSQVGNWNMGPASVQLMAGTNNQGSVTAIQGTNPWVMVGSVSGGVSSVGQVGNWWTGVTGSVATTFAASSLISGHASINGAGSVLVINSVQGTLYAYITDFLLSNTGATTTLVQFTDRDGSVMGKSIAPTGGGAVATAISSPMRTLVAGSPVYVGAVTATSTLHAWVGGYKGL